MSSSQRDRHSRASGGDKPRHRPSGEIRVSSQPEGQSTDRAVDLRLRFQEFRLPPVQGALVIGRRAPVGPRAMAEALESMLPGVYHLVSVDHPTIEGVVVRRDDLRRVPEPVLIGHLVREADSLMNEHETLHCSLEIEVSSSFHVKL